LADGNLDQTTGFQHGQADQAESDHMHEEFLVKGVGGVAMPGSGPEGMLKLAIEGFDVPAQMIETGQF